MRRLLFWASEIAVWIGAAGLAVVLLLLYIPVRLVRWVIGK